LEAANFALLSAGLKIVEQRAVLDLVDVDDVEAPERPAGREEAAARVLGRRAPACAEINGSMTLQGCVKWCRFRSSTRVKGTAFRSRFVVHF